MSKANRMFAALGYGYIEHKNGFDTYSTDTYESDRFKQVVFYFDKKNYEAYDYNQDYKPSETQEYEADNFNVIIDVELHMAITQKMKELGWL